MAYDDFGRSREYGNRVGRDWSGNAGAPRDDFSSAEYGRGFYAGREGPRGDWDAGYGSYGAGGAYGGPYSGYGSYGSYGNYGGYGNYGNYPSSANYPGTYPGASGRYVGRGGWSEPAWRNEPGYRGGYWNEPYYGYGSAPERRYPGWHDYDRDYENELRGYGTYPGYGGYWWSSGYAGAPADYSYTARDRGYGSELGRGELGRGNHVGRGPRGYQRSDERIEEDVNEQLTRHPGIDPTDVQVAVRDGEVTLTGSVSDRHAKRIAEDVAEDVSGVRDVHNQLRVSHSERMSGAEREVERTAEREGKAGRAERTRGTTRSGATASSSG